MLKKKAFRPKYFLPCTEDQNEASLDTGVTMEYKQSSLLGANVVYFHLNQAK